MEENKKELLNIASPLVDLIEGDESIYQSIIDKYDMKKIQKAYDFIVNNPKLNDNDKIRLMANSWRIHYRAEPPNEHNFISSKYLGVVADQTYDRVKNVFINFFEDKEKRNLILYPSIGFGKALRNDTKIFTPNGYILSGDIKEGDEVCTPDGNTAKVLKVFPQGEVDIYEITFKDGRKTYASKDHLWKVSNSKHISWSIQSTEYLMNTYKNQELIIPLTSPVNHTKKDHKEILPYTMGFTVDSCKNIPESFLYDSIHNRTGLLKGILDKYGEAINNHWTITVSSYSLMRDIMLLVWGLGGFVLQSSEEHHPENKYSFTFYFPVEKEESGLLITSIKKVDLAEATCILLDDEDHLYLTDDYIVTHNSYLSALITLYIATHISLMRNPKKFFGLNQATVLAQLLISYSLDKSSELLLEPMMNILEASPYFEKVRTKEGMIKKEMEFQHLAEGEINRIFWTTASPTSAIEFSNGSNIKLASSVHSLLGVSAVSGVISELAFFSEAGKALTLDTKIITPDGFKLMGDIKVGDIVSTPDGNSSSVVSVHPQGETEIYKMTFNDNRTILSCGNHLWKATNQHGYLVDPESKKKNVKKLYWETISTKEIYDRFTESKQKWRIPLTEPVNHIENKHLVHPYLLGYILGDGSIQKNQISITIGNRDFEESLSNLSSLISEDYTFYTYTRKDSVHRLTLVKRTKNNKPNIYCNEFNRLGLSLCRSYSKFIPKEYLYDSIENRVNLLQGLLDTDGYCEKNGTVKFFTSSERLRDDVITLVCGLGGTASFIEDNRVERTTNIDVPNHKQSLTTNKICYTVHIYFPFKKWNIFKLKRKQERLDNKYETRSTSKRQFNYIKSIELLEEKKETQCICIASSDKLYLAENYIVTHNSDEYIMKLYNNLKERIDSRMKGNYWGRSILDSSPNNIESPIDNYCWYEAHKDSSNLIVKGGRWQWAPEDFSGITETFPVYVGGSGKPPEVLESAEGYDPTDLLFVPKDKSLLQLFKNDTVNALKNIAGIPQGALDKLFSNYDTIERIFIPKMKNMYSYIQANEADRPEELIWNKIVSDFFIKTEKGYKFYYKPYLPRVVSIDQSISGDTTGISMCHVEMYKTELGIYEPIYIIDFTIAIVPLGGRINLDAIKLFVCDLVTKGNINLQKITFDSFQSEASIQYIKRQLNPDIIERLSVDKEMGPYLSFTQLINQNRIRVGRNIFLKNNLKSLRMVKRKRSETMKIDHTIGDTGNLLGITQWETSLIGFNAKDISDAVCASVEAARIYLAEKSTELFNEEEIIITPEMKKERLKIFLSQSGMG